MKVNQVLLGAAILASPLSGPAVAQQAQYVQIAELEIDPAQLESYKATISEHAETAIRVEPGVLVLFAVSEKENPTHVRVFEVYRDIHAYKGASRSTALQEI